MTKLYLIGLIGALCTIFYFYGAGIGRYKCEIQNVQHQINNINNDKQQDRVINEKVYKTGVRDIRSILRDKYTISE